MMRNLKVLGLALVAVLALSAVAASAASADKFATNATPPVKLTASGKAGATKFITTAGTNTCDESYTGTVTEKEVSAVTITPVYTNCTCIGVACVIDMNGCDYVLRVGAATTGTADIVCPEGKEITLTAGAPPPLTEKCTIHVPPQTNLSTVTYSNVGSTIQASFDLTAVKYTHTKGTGLGACTAGTSTTGSLTGTVTVSGEEDKEGGAAVPIFMK
jgi:hypothetical protein